MILITLGTGKYGMERLMNEICHLVDEGHITDKVIAQIGHTKCSHDKIECFDFLPYEQLQQLTIESDIIITHGGVASVNGALKAKKKIIIVPRLSKYEEALDDHQVGFAETLAKEGYVLSYNENSDLGLVLNQIKSFKPNIYKFDNSMLINKIRNYIDSI